MKYILKRRDVEFLTIAIFLWGTLFPYPFWGVAFSLVIILMVHSFLCIPSILGGKVRCQHLVNSFVMMLAGYLFIYSSEPERAFFAMTNFPKSIIYYILFSFLALNFIDIKDYKGDKKAGIKTIPTIFGEKLGKQIIGLFFIINYLLLYFLFTFEFYFLIMFLFLGFLQYYFINKKKYDERYIFIIYFITLINILIYKI